MVNYIEKDRILVVLADRDPHDLAEELARHPCRQLSIHGTPANLAAIKDYPDIEEVQLRGCEVADLSALSGLRRLRRLGIGFGPLASVDLSFCRETLESLELTRLKRLKDLRGLSPLPALEKLTLNHLHGFMPPDFAGFPRLQFLSIWKTDWPDLRWLAPLSLLEDLHISQIKVEDRDWRPLLELPRLRHLHGLRDVFKSAAQKEFQSLRPNVRVDQGIPVDLEKNPRLKEYLEEIKSQGTGALN